VSEPIDLIDFYRRRGARFLADVPPGPGDDRRMALHQAIRARYKVVMDRNDVFLVELTSPEAPPHGQ
jgi:hypothetical protein